MGLLTDGNSWDFHYIRQIEDGYEIYRVPRISTSTPGNIQLVLGIMVTYLAFLIMLGLLVHCCAGIVPREDETSLLRVGRSRGEEVWDLSLSSSSLPWYIPIAISLVL